MAQEEVLGIRIKIDLGDFQAGMDKITVALTAIGASAGKGAEAGVKATKSQLALLQAAWGGTLEEVKKKLADMYDIQQVQKFVKQKLDIDKAGLTAGLAAEMKASSERIAIAKKTAAEVQAAGRMETTAKSMYYNEAGGSYVASMRAKERQAAEVQRSGKIIHAAYLENERRIQDGGKAEVAAYTENARRIQAAGRLEVAARIDNARRIQGAGKAEVAAYAENARRVRRGGLDEASAHTENARRIQNSGRAEVAAYAENARRIQAAGRLEAAAYAENARRNAAGIGSPAKESNLLNISLKNMAARLVEFYSIRNVLFAVTTQLRDAVSGALDFNQKIHDIAAISGASEVEMRSMGSSILEIATHSKYTATEVGNLMEVLAQAGVMAKELPEVSGVVGMFATATGATPQQAADLYTTGANVWNVKTEDAAKVTNVLTAALNNAKLSVQGLTTTFSYLAPQAAMVGYSIEETAGMIATLSQLGIKASTIGTGLSQLMKDLSAPKPRFATLLESYGITLDQVNPRLHSFADIIEVFNQKGVKADEIMAKMDSRSGRSLVGSMLAGAASFRTMTESVTGTNSTILAYEKAMEGARAKMNVLKQEILKLTIQTGGLVSGGLSEAILGFTNFIKGLQSTQGQLVLVTASLGVATLAVRSLTLAAFANPILAGVSIGLAATVALIAALGSGTDAATEKAKALNEELNEKLRKSQAVSDGVTKIKNEVDVMTKLNPEVEKYNQLVKAGKGDSQEANELRGKQVTLTEDMRTSLYELKDAHENYFEGIDIEKVKYSELLGILDKVNEARSVAGKESVIGYNELQEQAVLRNMELEDLRKERDSHASVGSMFTQSAEEFNSKKPWSIYDSVKNTSRISDLEKEEADQAQEQAGLLAKKPSNYYKNKAGFLVPTPKRSSAAEEEYQKNLKITKDGSPDGSTDPTSPGRVVPFDFATWGKDKILQSEIDKRKSLITVLTNTFDDEKLTLEQKTDNYLEAYRLAEQEVTTEIDKKAAEALSKYNASTKTSGDKKVLRDLMASLNEQGQADLDKFNDTAIDKLHKGAGTTKTDDGLIGERTEKRQAITIANLQRANALRKEGVWTAQEQLAIDLETKNAELASLKVVEFGYAADQEKLKLKQELFAVGKSTKDLTDQEKAFLDQLPDLLENVRLKYAEINAERERMADQTVWGNLKQGMKQGVQDLGTMQTATAELGKSMIATFAGGISNALDGMITKLQEGKSGWLAFRDGMKGVMADIGKMIQQYITRLIAMWIIQKMVGLVAGSGGGGDAVSMSGSGINPTVPMTAAEGGLIQRLAGGGSVLNGIPGGQIPLNLGIRGKDSVPIIGMPGEYMIKEEAVNFYGVDFFRKANAKQLAEGGSFTGPSGAGKAAAGSKDGEGENTLNIYNIVDPNSIPKTSGTEILNVLSLEAQKNGPVFRQWKGLIKG